MVTTEGRTVVMNSNRCKVRHHDEFHGVPLPTSSATRSRTSLLRRTDHMTRPCTQAVIPYVRTQNDSKVSVCTQLRDTHVTASTGSMRSSVHDLWLVEPLHYVVFPDLSQIAPLRYAGCVFSGLHDGEPIHISWAHNPVVHDMISDTCVSLVTHPHTHTHHGVFLKRRT